MKKRKDAPNQKYKLKKQAKKTIDDYKNFAVKGNVMDLAIGVAVGAAFTNIINSIVTNMITPIVSLITRNVDIPGLFISLTGGNFQTIEEARNAGKIVVSYGKVIESIITFIVVSIILFIIYKYVSKMKNSNEKKEEEMKEKTTKKCPYCITSIDTKATKCPNCTSSLES